jgi:hypothetical protein
MLPCGWAVLAVWALIASAGAQLVCPGGLTPYQSDIVFLVDASSAVNQSAFADEITAVAALGSAFFAAAPSARMAAVAFADTACGEKGFCSVFTASNASFAAALDVFRWTGGATNTGAALAYAARYASVVRANTQFLVVAITAGASADSPITALLSLLRAGANVFAIGVGIPSATVEDLVAAPSEALSVPSFEDLRSPAFREALFINTLCPGKDPSF